MRVVHPDTEQLVVSDAGGVQRMANELVCEIEALRRRVVDLRGREIVHDRVTRQIADGNAYVLVAKVEADGERGIGDERKQHRRAAGVARPRAAGPVVLLGDARL